MHLERSITLVQKISVVTPFIFVVIQVEQETVITRDVRDIYMPMDLVYEALVKAGRLKGGQRKEEKEKDQEKRFC